MVKAGDLWYLKGDMHIHSHYSDGERLEKMLARVINCGFDFCAISDHDTFSGSRAALQMLEECRTSVPIIIRSQESTCSGCHILSYGTLEEYVKTAELSEVCQHIRSAGGYAVAAHPDWVHTRSFFRENGAFAKLVEENALDGVELMNFPKFTDGTRLEDEWTNRYYFERSKMGFPFAVTCGSDAHKADEITPERYLAVFAESCDEKGILEAIFRYKRSVAVWGNCVIGTPEACELFYSMPQNQARQQCTLEQTECRNGIRFAVSGADEIFACGNLQRESENTFFKPGFDHADALIIGRRNESYSAWHASTADKVDVKCVPVYDNGSIRASFKVEGSDDLVCKCRVNNEDFVFGTDNFICGTLFTEHNDIKIEVYDLSGVILCRREWDFPVCTADKWNTLEMMFADAPAPDGADPEARFRFSRNASDIVLDMEITDRFFCQPCSGFGMYMGDSVQFGLDISCAASENDLVDRKVWEFGIAVTDGGTTDFVVYNFPEKSDKALAEKLKYSAERVGDKTFYQIIFRKDFAEIGDVFGFNMIFNINDGKGRRGYLAWRKGIGDRKKSADWGYILLNESK